MPQLTPSSTGPSHLPRYQPGWNPLACQDLMASVLMVQQWSPGNAASCWSGMPLVPIQFAPSYRCQATHATGKVAAAAEKKKSNKYGHLGPAHIFMPVAMETLGAFGPRILTFIKELRRRICKATREEKASGFLLQRLSVAVQRGNAAAVMGTCLSP